MRKPSRITALVFVLGVLGWLILQKVRLEPNSIDYGQEQGEGSDRPIKSSVPNNGTLEERPHEKPSSSATKTIWEQGGFPERLQVADVDMPLLFEGSITDELKQVILADLSLILRHLTGHSYYVPRGLRSFSLGDQELSISKGIQLDGKGATWPDLLHGELLILNQGGEDKIAISRKVVKAYEKAWDARKSDPKKYEDLGVFVEWLNTASLGELKIDNPYWLIGYDGVSSSHPEEAAKMKDELLLGNAREDLHVRLPSILEFTYVDQEVLEKEGAVGKMPEGVTLADGKYIAEDGVPYQQALFLYDGEKWHIAFAPSGA